MSRISKQKPRGSHPVNGNVLSKRSPNFFRRWLKYLRAIGALGTCVSSTICSDKQGGESRGFLQLFFAWTERVRKMFIIFVILNEVSCGKMEKKTYLIRSDGISKFFMLCAVFFYTSSNKVFHTLLELVWTKTPCLITTLIQ